MTIIGHTYPVVMPKRAALRWQYNGEIARSIITLYVICHWDTETDYARYSRLSHDACGANCTAFRSASLATSSVWTWIKEMQRCRWSYCQEAIVLLLASMHIIVCSSY